MKFKPAKLKARRYKGMELKQNKETCIISGESSPHMCTPNTVFVFAHTISFINTQSGRPESVAFRGLKLAVKISTSPHS